MTVREHRSAAPIRKPIDPSERRRGGRHARSRRKFTDRRKWSRIRLIILAAAMIGIVVVALALDRTSTTGPSDPKAGMHLAFDGTFRGTTLDNSIWDTCYPWFVSESGCTNFGNSIQDVWYVPTGDVVAAGALHLVASATPTRGFTESGSSKTYLYSSGMVTTKKSFDFKYGYVQVVAKTPGGTGTWPALWLLPKRRGWPPEIDIMENWGSPYEIQTTFIWSGAGTVEQALKTPSSPSSLSNRYHTYGLLWEPGSLTWYLDGKVVDSYTGSQVPRQQMYFLANLAIDGPAVSGSSFNIRSVKIYTKK
jgi:beta-glucanase (GH16 family)